MIAVVMQDVFLFTGDINYNIRLNNQSITDADIVSAAKVANGHDMIGGFPGGYRQMVAERGSDFSLGQRQLISFARAVAASPQLLILDEATASIDSETEKALQDGLDNFAKGKTLLVIAHRISTIINSDVIFVMDKGEIAERGNHESLMGIEDGIYKKLYTLSLTSH
jgi:ATP-binding cassette subfamily B protein